MNIMHGWWSRAYAENKKTMYDKYSYIEIVWASDWQFAKRILVIKIIEPKFIKEVFDFPGRRIDKDRQIKIF